MNPTGLLRNVSDAWNGLTHGRTHFDEEWDRFKVRLSRDPQGCWAGIWKSETNRREGPLRCVLTRIAPATYIGTFCVRWFDRVPISYDVQFRMIEQRAAYELEGAADLGLLLGGVHHFKGRVNGHELVCTFSSAKDRGTFVLKKNGF